MQKSLRFRTWFRCVPSLVLATLLLVACGAPQQASRTSASDDNQGTPEVTSSTANTPPDAEFVRIGFVGSLSGPGAPYGSSANNAVSMVIDQVNEQGGVARPDGSHVRLELVQFDDRTETVGVTEAMERLTSGANPVPVIVGGLTTGNSVVAGDVAQRSQTPLLFFPLGDSSTAQGFEYVFRVTAGTADLARQAVAFTVDELDAQGLGSARAAIIADDGAFSQDSAAGVKAALEDTKIDLADEITFGGGSVDDFGPQIQRLTNADVDIVFVAVSPQDGVGLTQAMQTLEFNPDAVVHIGGAAADSEFDETLGSTADFTFGSSGFVSELTEGAIPELAEFSSRYEERFGQALDESSSSGATIMGLIIDAFSSVDEITASAVTDHLRSVDLDVGANQFIIRNGGVRFDPAGNNERAEPLVFQLLDGERRLVFPPELRTIEPVWPVPTWSER